MFNEGKFEKNKIENTCQSCLVMEFFNKLKGLEFQGYYILNLKYLANDP